VKRKFNLVGTLGVKSIQFPIVFKSVRKTPEKVTEKREFLRIISHRFFYFAVTDILRTTLCLYKINEYLCSTFFFLIPFKIFYKLKKY